MRVGRVDDITNRLLRDLLAVNTNIQQIFSGSHKVAFGKTLQIDIVPVAGIQYVGIKFNGLIRFNK